VSQDVATRRFVHFWQPLGHEPDTSKKANVINSKKRNDVMLPKNRGMNRVSE
jgi:hypothetical protein